MDIKAGLKPVTATLLPRFLYPDGQEYDEDDTASGILRGHLMIRVRDFNPVLTKCCANWFEGGKTHFSRAISSTRGGWIPSWKTRHHRLDSYHFDESSPHRVHRGTGMWSEEPKDCSLLFSQACFSISSSQQWSQLDGSFDYSEFYWNIVGLFDDGEGQEIIDFYNQWVPHHVGWCISWHSLQSYFQSTLGIFCRARNNLNPSSWVGLRSPQGTTCGETCSGCSGNGRSRRLN